MAQSPATHSSHSSHSSHSLHKDALSSLEVLLEQGMGIAEKILSDDHNRNPHHNNGEGARGVAGSAGVAGGAGVAGSGAGSGAGSAANGATAMVDDAASSMDAMDAMDGMLNDYNNNFLQIQGLLNTLNRENEPLGTTTEGVLQKYAQTHARVQTHVESIHNELVDTLKSTRKRKQAYKGYGSVFTHMDKSFLDNQG